MTDTSHISRRDAEEAECAEGAPPASATSAGLPYSASLREPRPIFEGQGAAYTAAFADLNAQARARRDAPPLAPDKPDGAMDDTPEHGPMPLPIIYEVAPGAWSYKILWGIHKHRWALDFWYCLGTAMDSRGERTPPHLEIDVRTLPKKYIGRFDIDKHAGCGRRSHRIIIARALADGFDLESFAKAESSQ